MRIAYNHDIDVSVQFARQFPAIEPLLRHDDLVTVFNKYDAVAKHHKARFLLLGRLSVVLATLALLGVTGELLAYALHGHPPLLITVLIELAAILALACLAINHLQHNRGKYLLACFARERLRHWRFQAFLDGELVSAVADDPARGMSKANDRLSAFKQELRGVDGTVAAFLEASTSSASLLHRDTAYTNAEAADQAFAALSTLRFAHQAHYPRRKIARTPSDQRVSALEQYHWVEAIAKVTLTLAAIIPAAQILLVLANAFGRGLEMHGLHVSLFAAAMGLGIVSAGARAYCAGMTLPEELDSYSHYAAHVDTLTALFNSAEDHERRRACLRELEFEAERELRRFLGMKAKASFLA